MLSGGIILIFQSMRYVTVLSPDFPASMWSKKSPVWIPEQTESIKNVILTLWMPGKIGSTIKCSAFTAGHIVSLIATSDHHGHLQRPAFTAHLVYSGCDAQARIINKFNAAKPPVIRGEHQSQFRTPSQCMWLLCLFKQTWLPLYWGSRRWFSSWELVKPHRQAHHCSRENSYWICGIRCLNKCNN